MNQLAIYPGMFDPFTNCHYDVVCRAAKLFDKVIVAVAKDSNKNISFSLEKRVYMVKEVLKDKDNITVKSFSGLLINFAKKNNSKILIRGLRAVSDFEYEFQLASMNRNLASDIESLFLMPNDQSSFISSTLVKQIARLKGDTSKFVPSLVSEALQDLYE